MELESDAGQNSSPETGEIAEMFTENPDNEGGVCARVLVDDQMPEAGHL